ncbi:MAG TPA: glutamate-cysteine ligase family protein, partial [Dermatophilaceae bacterium]|nr:glutamate-cysteine ligase family protein [Dermatophilaceae bacterium]
MRQTDEHVLPSADLVHGYIQRICFKTGPPGLVGAELEWPVRRDTRPGAAVPVAELTALLERAGPTPGGSRVTMEPGGQVELSSQPAVGVDRCHARLAGDVGHLQTALAARGLSLVPSGTDPDRPSRRQLTHPRYEAMAAYFAGRGETLGAAMMSSTAAVQVNLDAGLDDRDVTARWGLLHAVGPVLVAAFANSPRLRGRDTGWKSTRSAIWQHLDPSRTRPVTGGPPAAAYASYALDAPVMMLRRPGGRWQPDPGFTLRDWAARRVSDLAPP